MPRVEKVLDVARRVMGADGTPEDLSVAFALHGITSADDVRDAIQSARIGAEGGDHEAARVAELLARTLEL